MRKTINRTTVIVVLALFLCISVGYALFSDTITIEGTATAQGNFDITATCQTGVASEILTALGATEDDEFFEYPNSGYESDICTVSDDKVTFSTNLKYPNSGRIFTVKLTNTGSIDAIIKLPSEDTVPYFSANATIKVYNESDDSLFEEISESYNSYSGFVDSNLYNYRNVYPQITLEGTIVGDADGYITNDHEWLYENEFIYSNSNNEHYLRLKQNQSVYILGQAYWHKASEINGYYAETKSTFNFDFNQLTSDLELITDASKDNICLNGC